jgi:hypothetical protein
VCPFRASQLFVRMEVVKIGRPALLLAAGHIFFQHIQPRFNLSNNIATRRALHLKMRQSPLFSLRADASVTTLATQSMIVRPGESFGGDLASLDRVKAKGPVHHSALGAASG